MGNNNKRPVPGQRRIEGKSRTQQHFKKETDINTIVRRYLPTGQLPSTGRQPMYGDFTSFDYMSMLNAVSDIDTTFRQLPARIRGMHRNNPYQLLRWLENPANQKEAVRLGMLQDPARPFGRPDDETQLENDQTDLMSQADIMDALDPENKAYDPSVVSDLQAAAQGGDAESQLLLDAHAARQAARKAQKAEGSRTAGPLKKRPQAPRDGD